MSSEARSPESSLPPHGPYDGSTSPSLTASASAVLPVISQASYTPYIGLVALFSVTLDGRIPAPLVHISRIPEVSLSDFDRFLKQVSGSFAQWRVNREGQVADDGEVEIPSDRTRDREADHLENTLRSLGAYDNDGPQADGNEAKGENSSNRSIPELYFSPEFSLKNDSVFMEVLEHQNLPQNHLYLEQKLAELVQERASRFFAALEQMKSLSGTTGDLLGEIRKLRTHSQCIELQASRRLEYVEMARVRRNLSSSLKYVRSLSALSKTEQVVDGLVMEGAWTTAFEVMDNVRNEEWASQLTCMTGIRHRLKERYYATIEKAQQLLLLSLLKGLDPNDFSFNESFQQCLELARQGTGQVVVIEGPGDLGSPLCQRVESAWVRNEIQATVAGLVKVNELDRALRQLRDRAARRSLDILQAHETALANAVCNPGNATTSPEIPVDLKPVQSDNILSAVPFSVGLAFFMSYFRCLQEILLNLKTKLAVIHELEPRSSSLSHEIIHSIFESVQEKIPTLSIPNHIAFRRLHETHSKWTTRLEDVTNLTAFALRSRSLSMSRGFLASFSKEKQARVTGFLEMESWSAADVAVDFQKIVDRLQKKPHIPDDSLKKPFISILGERFIPTVATLMLLQTIDEYLDLFSILPALSVDVLGKMTAVVRNYNETVAQLILGAGAVKAGIVKSITPRHLALASRSLGLVRHVIGLVQAWLRERMSDKHATFLVSLETLCKDLENHEKRVYNKFRSIMCDRLESHVHPKQTAGTSSTYPLLTSEAPYLTIAKETATLRRVLERYLPQPLIAQEILKPISELYADTIGEEIRLNAASVKVSKHTLLEWVRVLSKSVGMDGRLERTVMKIDFKRSDEPTGDNDRNKGPRDK